MHAPRIIYFPLEPYQERYTAQLSAPKTGWLEKNWIKYEVPYVRIEGGSTEGTKINTGQVVDALKRSQWCAQQLVNFYAMLERGEIQENDVLFFEDMWHPGIEAIAYMKSIGVPLKNGCGMFGPKIYVYCWAQSVDRYDFTNQMMPWIRHYEKMIGGVVNGIFVANTLLAELLQVAGITNGVLHASVVGLPFDSESVAAEMWEDVPNIEDRYECKNQVVFTSRLSAEKQPTSFLAIADQFFQRIHDNYPEHSALHDTEFIFCTPYERHHPNMNNFCRKVETFTMTHKEYQGQVYVAHCSTKKDYYRIMRNSVQVNTSLQDWVSFTLLEALVGNCRVLYPNHRSFPEVFRNAKPNQSWDLYPHSERHTNVYGGGTIDDRAVHFIVESLTLQLEKTNNKNDAIKNWQRIGRTHDHTWLRMTMQMFFGYKDFQFGLIEKFRQNQENIVYHHNPYSLDYGDIDSSLLK